MGSFAVTLTPPGPQSITATDTVTSTITGTQTAITVNGIAPATLPDAYTALTGTTLTVPTATGVLANDTKGTPAGTITAHTPPGHGTLTLASDGSFSYTPTAGYVGTDAFTYTLSNGNGTFGTGSGTGTVTLTALTTTAPTGSGNGNGGTLTAPTMRVGSTLTLTTSGTYTNGATGSVNGLTYTGYNPQVLSVNANGVVTALSGGSTTVTITAPNGVTTVITITITVSEGSGSGLMAPAPQPGAKPAGMSVAPGTPVAPQPTRKADGT